MLTEPRVSTQYRQLSCQRNAFISGCCASNEQAIYDTAQRLSQYFMASQITTALINLVPIEAVFLGGVNPFNIPK